MGRDSQAIWIPSPFCTAGRSGYTAAWIIVHGTAGGSSAQGVAAWFQNQAAQVSSHYVVGQDGTIIQCVDEADWAWSNGVISGPSGKGGDGVHHDSWWDSGINPNILTIAIECVKPHIDNSDVLTTTQRDALFALIKRVGQRWNIPMRLADKNGGITGHYSIDPVNRSECPGAFSWDELWAYLGAANTQTSQTQGDSDMSVDLTDPVMASYFTDIGGGRWRCKKNNVDLIGAIKNFYCKLGGVAVLGLPLCNEIYNVIPSGGSIVVCERAIIAYDPGRKNDNPPLAGNCYLMHIDNGKGQQMIAQPLVKSLQDQLTALQQQQAASAQAAAMAQALNQIYSICQPYGGK